jgi:hypothetical protein
MGPQQQKPLTSLNDQDLQDRFILLDGMQAAFSRNAERLERVSMPAGALIAALVGSLIVFPHLFALGVVGITAGAATLFGGMIATHVMNKQSTNALADKEKTLDELQRRGYRLNENRVAGVERIFFSHPAHDAAAKNAETADTPADLQKDFREASTTLQMPVTVPRPIRLNKSVEVSR